MPSYWYRMAGKDLQVSLVPHEGWRRLVLTKNNIRVRANLTRLLQKHGALERNRKKLEIIFGA